MKRKCKVSEVKQGEVFSKLVMNRPTLFIKILRGNYPYNAINAEVWVPAGISDDTVVEVVGTVGLEKY